MGGEGEGIEETELGDVGILGEGWAEVGKW